MRRYDRSRMCCWFLLHVTITGSPASAQPSVAAEAERAPSVSVTADPTGDGGRIQAQIRIAARPEMVWAVMMDCATSLRIVAGLKDCKILKRDPAGKWDIREHTIKRALLLPTVRSVFRSDYEPVSGIRFSRVEGDLKKLQGSWRLVPLNGGTATDVIYNADVDPGVPLPGVLLRSAIKSDVADVLSALQRETEARNGR